MKTIAALLPIMFLYSSVSAQAVPAEVKRAVTNAVVESYSRFFVTEARLIKCEEGHPSQEFIHKYNPKKVYCATCRNTLIGKDEPSRGKTIRSIISVIAIATQSGEVEILCGNCPGLNYDWMSSGAASKKYLELYRSIWRRNCPYPYPDSE
jgi:hypothetical protein